MADYVPTTDDLVNALAYWGRLSTEEAVAALSRRDSQERAHLADLFSARAAQSRATSAQFLWQQAARIAGGDDRG